VRIGVPREIKNNEFRVALTPAGADELVRHGHDVVVETGAGDGSSLPDEDFLAVGAKILGSADDVWGTADLVVKVKEPVADEFARMRDGQVLFTYLHLAAGPDCTRALLDAGVTAIAYETVRLPSGALPLLAPMSEIAGRLAPQTGAAALLRPAGGRGVLLGGVPGVRPGKVVVIGAGVAGSNAVAIAAGMRAEVVVLDRSVAALKVVDELYHGAVRTVASSSFALERELLDADLVVGAVLVPGAKAPSLVSNDLVSRMKRGSVLVDISIDQGGCFADSHPTTHAEPTYPVHGSLFYCVANMPGAVPHSSTWALTNATLPYLVELADLGWRDALRADPTLAAGLSTTAGTLTSAPVGAALSIPVVDPEQVLAA